MELRDYLNVLRKRWVTIVVTLALSLGAAVALTMLTTPVYESRSQVFVSVRSGGSTSDLLQGSNFTTRQVKSYAELVTSPRVLVPVIERLDLPIGPEQLASHVRANSPVESVLINITAGDTDPRTASDIANATAASLAEQVIELEKPDDGPSPVQISTVRVASPASSPSTPNLTLNLALGLLVGLGGGVGLAALRHALDTRVRTAADVTALSNAPLVAQIAYDTDAPRHPLIVHTDPRSPRAESFRRLRTNLQYLQVGGRSPVVVLTSSLPGEGKTTTAINLAISLADAGQKVILVDADLRRPAVARYMGLEGRAGLTTVLIGRAEVGDVVQPWGGGNLHVLPAGRRPPNPSELLESPPMQVLLDELVEQYDAVVLDTAPLLPVTDGAVLARLTGGALLVVGANKVDRGELQESLTMLRTAGTAVHGIVLNRVARRSRSSYDYYDAADDEDDDA